jgi:multidrug efflux system membrane fusion protein
MKNKMKALPLNLALVFLLLTGCSEEQKITPPVIRPIKTLLLNNSASQEKIRTFPGKVHASRQVDLAFRISGPLIEFPVKEGQEVKQGDLLARIDPRDYRTELSRVKSALAEARANLNSMKAGARPEDIKVLKSQVVAAQARRREAGQNFERQKKLYAKNVGTKADYDRYESARDVAKAQLNTASQNLKKGQKGARKEDVNAMTSRIRGLEAHRKQAAAALDDTFLKAPFSGVIAKKFVENFQDVGDKKSIVSLQDVSSIEILVHIPEKDMATVKEKDIATITAKFDFLPGREFLLQMKEHGTEADPQTKTYPITLSMPSPKDVSLLPGMTATITARFKADTTAKVIVCIPSIWVRPQSTGKRILRNGTNMKSCASKHVIRMRFIWASLTELRIIGRF